MSDLQGKLRRADLSSSQLTDMGGFDPRFVIYLLSLRDDLLTIADHVEPPGGATPGLLRDDLDGVGDIATAPTSNQAYTLNQKTITNTQLISQLNQVVIDHVGEINPHNTSLLDLIDIANSNYIGLARSVPVVTNDEQGIIIRRLFAVDLLFDDTNIGSGAADQQALDEYLDNQIALREAAPSTVILTGAVMTRVTDTTIDVSPGSMQVIDAYTDRSAPPSVLASLSFAGVTGLTIDMPDRIGIQTVYLDLAGNIMQQPGRLTNAQTRTLTRIGFVDYKDGVIGKPHPAKFLINEAGNLLRDFLEYFPPENRLIGLNVNPVDNLLSIFGDSGTIFIIGVNHEINALDPNVETFPQIGDSSTAVPFDVKFGGNLADFLTNQLVIPKFYESAPGVATALSGNDATIMYVYRTFNDEFIIQLGVNVYTNGAAARDALGTDLNGHVGFDGSSSTFLLAQIYADRTSVDFIDQNKAGVVSITGAGGGAGGGSVLWGDIGGLLSNQGDVQDAFDLKFDKTGGGISGAVSLVDQLQIRSTGLDNTTRISFTNTLGNIFGEIESLIGSRDLLITRRDNSAVFTASSLRFKNTGNIETSFNGPPVSDRDITPKSYVDTRAPLGNFSATGDPVNSSDSTLGYSAGSDWINTTTDTGFKCMDATVGAAIWKQITA